MNLVPRNGTNALFYDDPLSIAQYLPTDFSGFDLVVSRKLQITVWDAVVLSHKYRWEIQNLRTTKQRK